MFPGRSTVTHYPTAPLVPHGRVSSDSCKPALPCRSAAQIGKTSLFHSDHRFVLYFVMLYTAELFRNRTSVLIYSRSLHVSLSSINKGLRGGGFSTILDQHNCCCLCSRVAQPPNLPNAPQGPHGTISSEPLQTSVALLASRLDC